MGARPGRDTTRRAATTHGKSCPVAEAQSYRRAADPPDARRSIQRFETGEPGQSRTDPRRDVAFGALLVLLFATLGTAASASPPTRYDLPAQPLELPAGLGCSFPVSGIPDDKAGYRATEFSDGRTLFVGQGNPTMTNVETGQAIQPRFHLSRLETTGALAGTVNWETRGSFLFLLFPGEPGPYGPVEAPGALLALTGRAVATYDSSSDQIIAFSFEGSITDLCAALAG